MIKKIAVLIFFLLPSLVKAQNTVTIPATSAQTGNPCTFNMLSNDTVHGVVYTCINGVFAAASSITSGTSDLSGACAPSGSIGVNTSNGKNFVCNGTWSQLTAGMSIPVQASGSSGSVLYSGTYTSGISATGSSGQTCSLTSFNGGGSSATATVALTGTNAIAAGQALVITNMGSSFTSAPTSATAGNGTATCSGTAVVATVLGLPVADPSGNTVYLCANSGGCIFTTAAGATGAWRSYRNSTGIFGVVTIQMPASNTADLGGSNTSSAGCLVSGGAAADSITLVSDASNHWYAYNVSGTWSIQSGNGCL